MITRKCLLPIVVCTLFAMIGGCGGESRFKDFDEAIRLDPNDALAYYNRGRAKYNLNDKTAAIKDYDEAIRLDPKNAIAYRFRGIAKSGLEDETAAIKDYDEAIRLDPKDELAYLLLENLRSKLKPR